jgi:hypothetical protein
MSDDRSNQEIPMRFVILLCCLCLLGPQTVFGGQLQCSVSWIGNSFPGAQKWVQQDIRTMLVTPDGTVYTNTEWDEAGREVGVYKDGEVIGKAGHTHGWGYMGGEAIVVNDKYIFQGERKCVSVQRRPGSLWG